MTTSEALQSFLDRGALAGAVVLVADNDRIREITPVGYADVAARQPMRENTYFWIASQTKPITGTLLMMLVDEGQLSLADPVEKYLPEFKTQMVIVEQDATHRLLRPPQRPVTITDLMSHTSGLPFSVAAERPVLGNVSLQTAAAAYAMAPLEHEPGSKYLYSNAGINAAGRIIEIVAGQPFQEFLAERLLRPLGMADTTFWPTAGQVARLPKVYKPNADQTAYEETPIVHFAYPLESAPRHPSPGGGLFSSARDCGRFCQMILNRGTFEGRRYLSEAAVATMTSRQTPAQLTESYGIGWQVGADSCGHGGALSTNMSVHWQKNRVTVFLVQNAGFIRDGAKAQEAFRQAALD